MGDALQTLLGSAVGGLEDVVHLVEPAAQPVLDVSRPHHGRSSRLPMLPWRRLRLDALGWWSTGARAVPKHL